MERKTPTSNAPRAAQRSLSVVDGGRLNAVPQVIVVDAAVLRKDGRDALERAKRLGIRVWHPEGMRSSDRAAWLAHWCEKWGLEFRAIAVIATDPEDVGMMLEAGVAYALETAGYDACATADRVFPARERGGLVQAIDVVCGLLG